MKKYKFIFWDMDGTLANTYEGVTNCVKYAMEPYGIHLEGEEELRKFIIHDLHSGATVYEAIGAYNMEKHNEIITIVDKSEYQKLMKFINEADPRAFITVYNVSDMRYQPKK